jgi:hypothetical protein
MLGEHFFISHNNYQDYTQLDDKVSDGFPGFELLEYIGMINYTNIDNTVPGGMDKLIKKENKCPICFSIYKYEERKYKYNPNNKSKKVLDYDSDSEIFINKLDYSNLFVNDDQIIYNDDKHSLVEITDKNLIETINKIRLTERLPIIMNCCDCTLCEECLENYITFSNSIICPFCKKDHTREDLDYVTYIIPSDTTDREKWLPWWKNHVTIFY